MCEHVEKALTLTDAEVGDLRALAGQLQDQTVVPILGAGASHDCGMRLAGQIAADMHADCDFDQDLKIAVESVEATDLGKIAEAIFNARGEDQQAVLEAIGLPDPALWPSTDEIDEHFCVLRVLARAVREHEGWKRAVGFNYDCCGEAALKSEGYRLSRGTRSGRIWLDHADVICSKRRYDDTTIRSGFELVKAHGCAEHYRTEYTADPSATVTESVIIRAAQIDSWCDREWARVALSDRVRNAVVVLIGFSGQDPATVDELRRVLEDVTGDGSKPTRPRLVVIDWDPDTDALQQLIAYGVGPDGDATSAVTRVSTAAASTTAVLLVLLAEIVGLELGATATRLGYGLPSDLEARLALLALAGPAMSAWTFFLNKPLRDAGLQHVNLAMAGGSPYVPMRPDAEAAIRSFRAYEGLRDALGLQGLGSARGVCETGGWIVNDGKAYMPTGLELSTLVEAATNGALAEAKDVLHWPRDLSAVLVCEGGGQLRGLSIERDREVEVP